MIQFLIGKRSFSLNHFFGCTPKCGRDFNSEIPQKISGFSFFFFLRSFRLRFNHCGEVSNYGREITKRRNYSIPKALQCVFHNTKVIKYLILIFLLSCTYQRDIQVHREIVTLVKVEQVGKGEKWQAQLSWQSSSGEIFTEFSEWPCYMPEGTKFIMLVRR